MIGTAPSRSIRRRVSRLPGGRRPAPPVRGFRVDAARFFVDNYGSVRCSGECPEGRAVREAPRLVGVSIRRPFGGGEELFMKFIVEPQKEEQQDRKCKQYITMCALCSEDPRFCGDWW
jgi:hypothetical protein